MDIRIPNCNFDVINNGEPQMPTKLTVSLTSNEILYLTLRKAEFNNWIGLKGISLPLKISEDLINQLMEQFFSKEELAIIDNLEDDCIKWYVPTWGVSELRELAGTKQESKEEK